MNRIKDMFQTHPQQSQMKIDRETLANTIQELHDCAQACVICADACLGEQGVNDLVRCIRLNQICADVCQATGRVLSRFGEQDWNLKKSLIENCIIACQMCGSECGKHASHHEHCRICAESCRRCEEACSTLLRATPVAVGR